MASPGNQSIRNTIPRSQYYLEGSRTCSGDLSGQILLTTSSLILIGGAWIFFETMFLHPVTVPTDLSNLVKTGSPAHITLGLLPTVLDSFGRDPAAMTLLLVWLMFCTFVLLNIGWHFFMLCSLDPGSVVEGLGRDMVERRIGPGSGVWWSRYRTRALSASRFAWRHEPLLAIRVVPQEPPEQTIHARSHLESRRRTTDAAAVSAHFPHASLDVPIASNCYMDYISRLVRASSSSNVSHASSRSIPVTHEAGDCMDSVCVDGDAFFPTQTRHSNVPAISAHSDSISERTTMEDLYLRPYAGICRRCSAIPLAKAISLLPAELRKFEILYNWQSAGPTSLSDIDIEDDDAGEAEIQAMLGEQIANERVLAPQPERSNHCERCNTCILKYDHHSLWLNTCIGMGNERHYFLLLTWLTIGCIIVTCTGWRVAVASISKDVQWPNSASRTLLPLFFVAASSAGPILGFKTARQLLLICRGETRAENMMYAQRRVLVPRTREPFLNVYDVGWCRNMSLFFNVGRGSPHHWSAILLPFRTPPSYSDGWHWAKCYTEVDNEHAPTEAMGCCEVRDSHPLL